MKPATILACHRRGLRLFWSWKGRRRTGRSTILDDVRALIRTMSHANTSSRSLVRARGSECLSTVARKCAGGLTAKSCFTLG